mmetsp:Transcript_8746/g.12519  ORF Transcript_8746/g.12519 Transcript_8746/m.12519 type:complete len:102 (+) Transcript_8746:410-715(+)
MQKAECPNPFVVVTPTSKIVTHCWESNCFHGKHLTTSREKGKMNDDGGVNLRNRWLLEYLNKHMSRSSINSRAFCFSRHFYFHRGMRTKANQGKEVLHCKR